MSFDFTILFLSFAQRTSKLENKMDQFTKILRERSLFLLGYLLLLAAGEESIEPGVVIDE